MYIKRIVIENFKSVKKEDIVPFYQGLSVITGKNGSGKSNLVDSVKFVLMHKNTRLSYFQKEKLLHLGQNSCSVAIYFDIDGEKITLKRTMTKKQKGKFDFLYYKNGFLINAEKYRETVNKLCSNIIIEEENLCQKADLFEEKVENSKIYISDNIFCSLEKNRCEEVANYLKEKAKYRQIIVVSTNKVFASNADFIIEMPNEHKEIRLKSIVFSISENTFTLEKISIN